MATASARDVERLQADGVTLVISVDCGIRGIEGGQARTRNSASTSSSRTITSPTRNCRLPWPSSIRGGTIAITRIRTAGVGVALKLVQALCRKRDRERLLPAFIKVAAIGTLADVVPLIGENRVIAKLGLELLSAGPHKVGLRALIEVAGLAGKPIDSGHVAFQIAPRMNAAGRMASPDIAARLLLAADEAMAAEAQDLARQLDGENVRRQEEEAGILASARRSWKPIRPSVHAASWWWRAKAGIAASSGSSPRSSSTSFIGRPSSSRSTGRRRTDRAGAFAGFDVLAALEHSAKHLTRFGGHKQAAGLTLPSAVGAFRETIADYADNLLGPTI